MAGWLAEEGGIGQRVAGSSSTTLFHSFILKEEEEEEEEEGDLWLKLIY